MRGLLVDSNVLFDLFEDDPVWAPWSEEKLDQLSVTHALCINPIICAEISVGFERIEQVEAACRRLRASNAATPQRGAVFDRQSVR